MSIITSKLAGMTLVSGSPKFKIQLFAIYQLTSYAVALEAISPPVK